MSFTDRWITLIAIGLFLFVPLAYGLGTLRGLREKWVYPLLRRRMADGRIAAITTEDRPYIVAHLGESSPPIGTDRRMFKLIH